MTPSKPGTISGEKRVRCGATQRVLARRAGQATMPAIDDEAETEASTPVAERAGSDPDASSDPSSAPAFNAADATPLELLAQRSRQVRHREADTVQIAARVDTGHRPRKS